MTYFPPIPTPNPTAKSKAKAKSAMLALKEKQLDLFFATLKKGTKTLPIGAPIKNSQPEDEEVILYVKP